jgi:hypothetical protein
MMEPNEPGGELFLTYEEFAVAAGIRPTVLARLVRLGVVEPARSDAAEFTVTSLARVRRMLRLQAQLGVNFTGAAVILDLLDRLHRLERGSASPATAREHESGRLPPGDASM